MSKIKDTINTYKNIGFMLKHIHKASPTRLVVEIIMAILNSMTNILFNVVLIKIISNAIVKNISLKNTMYYIVVIILYKVIVTIITLLYQHKYLLISNQKLLKYFSEKLYEKAVSIELACYEDPKFYNSYIMAIGESNGRCMQVIGSFTNIINTLFNLSTMSFVIITINPYLIVFIIIPVIFQLIMGKPFNKIKYNNYLEQIKKNRRKDYISRLFYLKEYSEELKLSNIKNVLINDFNKTFEDLYAVIKKYSKKIIPIEILKFFSQTVVGFYGAMIFCCFQTVVVKSMEISNCIIAINAISRVTDSILNTISIFINFQSQSLYIENLKFFINYKSKMDSNNNGLERKSSNNIISFNNVYFKYKASEDYVLKDISLEIKSNEKIAIVGYNGAGKSTFIKLLMRLYDVTEGEILLNGENIKAYNLENYRELFSVLFQNFKLFSLSIKENISMGKKICDEDIVNALKKVDMYDKISSFKNGINTTLSCEYDDNGQVLSGGENQKIALCRCLLNNNEIIILDEPSSALDPESEYKMYKTIMELCKNKTIIFISHRLSSTILADKIYVINDSKIQEIGNHKELMKKDGLYAEMFRKQSECYKKKVET